MTTPLEHLYDVDDLPSDTRVLGGRVVVDVRIGRGGAATVYAATTADGKDVALKVMTAAYASIPSSRQRFRNEFATAQHLADHPFVVTPYETGELAELGGRPYILMPLVKGRSLVRLVGQLSVVEAVTLMRDLARVVADVHARGIIHRDIKPGNVIVRDDGLGRTPYLIDFGLAYSDGAANAPVTAGLTAAHELPGTKHYMAPEQILGAPPDPRFDVYALAITSWEVLTGVLALEELRPADAARRKCDAGLPSLSIVGKVPGLPPELERAIDAALERDPERRTASAERFAEHLTGGLAAMQQRGSPLVVVRSDGEQLVEEARSTTPNVEVTTSRIEGSVREPVATRAGAEARWAAWAVVVSVVVVALLGTAWSLRDPERAQAKDTPAATAAEAGGIVEASTGSFGDGEAELEVSDVAAAAPEAEPRLAADVGAGAAGSEAETGDEPSSASGERRPIEPTRPPAHRTERCIRAVAAARSASLGSDWSRVLASTSDKRCFEDSAEWAELRVWALSETGRLDECIALGERSKRSAVRRLARSCQARKDHP